MLLRYRPFTLSRKNVLEIKRILLSSLSQFSRLDRYRFTFEINRRFFEIEFFSIRSEVNIWMRIRSIQKIKLFTFKYWSETIPWVLQRVADSQSSPLISLCLKNILSTGIHININSSVCHSPRFSFRPPSRYFDTLPKFNAKNATINSAKANRKNVLNADQSVKCEKRTIWYWWLAFEQPVNHRDRRTIDISSSHDLNSHTPPKKNTHHHSLRLT